MATKKKPTKREEEDRKIWEAVYHGEGLEELLDAGLDPNYKLGGIAPLIVTARSPEAVTLLLERGADPNAIGERGSAALHKTHADYTILRLLYEGADPSIKNDEGRRPEDGCGEHDEFALLTLRFWRQKKLGMRAPMAHKPFLLFALEHATHVLGYSGLEGFVAPPRGSDQRPLWDKQIARAWLDKNYDCLSFVFVPKEPHFTTWASGGLSMMKGEDGFYRWQVTTNTEADSDSIDWTPSHWFFFTPQSPDELLEEFKASALARKERAELEALVPKVTLTPEEEKRRLWRKRGQL